jgi:multidrug efflux pump subunit AcrB
VGQPLVLAVVLIYAILASQFGSFLQPLAVMLSLPLAFELGSGAESRVSRRVLRHAP